MAPTNVDSGEFSTVAAKLDEVAGEFSASVTFGAIQGSASAGMPGGRATGSEGPAIAALTDAVSGLVDAIGNDATALRTTENEFGATDESGAGAMGSAYAPQ